MPLTLKNNNEVFKQIFEIANQFDKEQENYLIAYSHFLNYFKKQMYSPWMTLLSASALPIRGCRLF